MLTSLSPLQPLLPQIQTPFVLTCSHCVLPSRPLPELLPRPRTPSPPPPFAAYCYLLQHNKSTKFSSLKHKCLLSHSFCVGQEPGKSSPGRFWRRVSHKVTIKPELQSSDCFTGAGRFTFELTHQSHSYWPEVSIPWHTTLSIGRHGSYCRVSDLREKERQGDNDYQKEKCKNVLQGFPSLWEGWRIILRILQAETAPISRNFPNGEISGAIIVYRHWSSNHWY